MKNKIISSIIILLILIFYSTNVIGYIEVMDVDGNIEQYDGEEDIEDWNVIKYSTTLKWADYDHKSDDYWLALLMVLQEGKDSSYYFYSDSYELFNLASIHYRNGDIVFNQYINPDNLSFEVSEQVAYSRPNGINMESVCGIENYIHDAEIEYGVLVTTLMNDFGMSAASAVSEKNNAENTTYKYDAKKVLEIYEKLLIGNIGNNSTLPITSEEQAYIETIYPVCQSMEGLTSAEIDNLRREFSNSRFINQTYITNFSFASLVPEVYNLINGMDSSNGEQGGNDNQGGHTLGDVISDADGFLSIGNGSTDDTISTESMQTMSNTLYNILFTTGVIIAFIIGGVLGIKFMTEGLEGKAEVKAMLAPYIVGCIILFGAFTIWKVVLTILQS